MTLCPRERIVSIYGYGGSAGGVSKTTGPALGLFTDQWPQVLNSTLSTNLNSLKDYFF